MTGPPADAGLATTAGPAPAVPGPDGAVAGTGGATDAAPSVPGSDGAVAGTGGATDAAPSVPGSDGAVAGTGGATDAAPSVPGPDGVGVWHLVDVADVAMALPSPYPEVVLQEREAPFRVLRVPVALADGTAIAHAWRKQATPRPLTHELFVDVLGRHQVVIEAVRVTAVEDGIFHAELDTTGRTGRQVVPCRTSDALALALRQRPTAPILVAEWVLAERSGPPA